jgi:hypothetical protein
MEAFSLQFVGVRDGKVIGEVYEKYPEMQKEWSNVEMQEEDDYLKSGMSKE